MSPKTDKTASIVKTDEASTPEKKVKAAKSNKPGRVAKTDQVVGPDKKTETAKIEKPVKAASVAKTEKVVKAVKTARVAKIAKANMTNLKRLPAGLRTHERRMKQAAHQEGTVYKSLIAREVVAKKTGE